MSCDPGNVFDIINSLPPSDEYLSVILTITGSDDSLLPVLHQAIIYISVGLLVIKNLETHFSEI